MKLVMFTAGGNPRLGCLREESVIDLNLACEALLTARGDPRPRAKAQLLLPPETVAFLQAGEEALALAREACAWLDADIRGQTRVRGLAKDRRPPTYMQPGDLMETEIEKLGLMRNPIQDEAAV